MYNRIKLHKLPVAVLTVLLFICVSAAAGFYAIRNVSVAQAAQITAPKTLEELREADPNKVAKLSYFDGREYGYVTQIRRQTTNTCWAHAITAAMELNIMRNEIDPDLDVETFDLSEHNLAWQTFNRDENVDPLGNSSAFVFEGEWDRGYNISAARVSLFQWSAPRETSDEDDFRNAKEGEVKYFAKDIIKICDSFVNVDKEEIKAAIVKYGAVTFSFNSTLLEVGDVYYNDTRSKKVGNSMHACTIIGWDDNIPAANYKSVETYQNGGWLVRNSWGKSNDEGYFWFSYDCALDEVYAFDMGLKSVNDNNYYYDGKEASGGIGSDDDNKPTKAAVIFEAKCGTDMRELVKGVGVDVYADSSGTKIKVDFYRNVTADKNDRMNVDVNLPESGEHVATVIRTVYYQGFYNITLNEEDWFKVEKGSYFSAVISVYNGSMKGCQEYYEDIEGATGMTYIYFYKTKTWSHKINKSYPYTFVPRISCYTVVVEGRDITESEILLEKVAYEYTGKPIEPRVAVIYHGALIPLEDYSITYLNNVNVGKATLIIDGIRDYACSVTCNFYIIKGKVPELSFKDLDVEYKNGELKVSPDSKRLSDITLPADWEWAEPDSEIVDDMEATAVYIGEDKQNYLNLTKTLHITVESVLDNDGDKDNDADNGTGSDTDNNTGTGNSADSGTDNNVDINATENKGFSWAWLALPAGIIIIGAVAFVIIITRKNRNG